MILGVPLATGWPSGSIRGWSFLDASRLADPFWAPDPYVAALQA
jgi:hypothetical protein